jgi:PAS domain S-box-containing protein
MATDKHDNSDRGKLFSSPCAMHESDASYMGLGPEDTERMQMSAELLTELGQTLLYRLPDAVIYADSAGAIRFWNLGAERIFGFSAAEAIGDSLDIIIPPRLRARHWEGYHRMMSTGQSSHAAAELLAVPAINKASDMLSIQFTVAPVQGRDGSVKGILALLRDVTDTFNELKRLKKLQA